MSNRPFGAIAVRQRLIILWLPTGQVINIRVKTGVHFEQNQIFHFGPTSAMRNSHQF